MRTVCGLRISYSGSRVAESFRNQGLVVSNKEPEPKTENRKPTVDGGRWLAELTTAQQASPYQMVRFFLGAESFSSTTED
jgi:hypothetical protein